MSDPKRWILTDVAADIWQDQFRTDHQSIPGISAGPWSIRKRTLRGGRRDGIDLIEVDNGALTFSVLPTRGMGLWRGSHRGLRLGWQAPMEGPVHPRHVNLLDRGGLGWLDGFDEWVCRCGLSSNGPPGEDPKTKEFLPLHGRIANCPAHYVEVQVGTTPPHELRVIGQVDEATLFFTRLRLTSHITTAPGSNRLVIHDVIENLSTKPADLGLLYHCQFGPPFLEAGSRFHAPIKEVAPRNERAAEGIDSFHTYVEPTAGFVEQVYFFDLLSDASGKSLALLHNASGDRGVVVRMSKAELPRFIVWKNTAATEDGYVTGLEPATNYPNFKSVERDRGRVMVLPPKGRHVCQVTIEVHDSIAGVVEARREIDTLQGSVTPIIHHMPKPDW